MISQRSNWLTKLAAKTAQTPWLVVTFLLLVLFNVLMSAPGLPFSGTELEKVSGGYGPLDITFGYSKAYVDQAITAYGDVGKTIYARYQLLDLFFPAIYSLFLGGLLFRLFGRNAGMLSQAYYLPFLGATLDYIENGLLFSLVRAYPDVSAFIVTVASILTVTKFLFPLLTVIALLLGGVQWLRMRTQRAVAHKP